MKKKIVLLFGGRSSEHEVSMNSAKSVFHAMDKTKYEVILVGISKQGTWIHLQEDLFEKLDMIDDSHMTSLNVVSLISQKGHGILWVHSLGAYIHFDCVFPVIHGTNGEDGTLQGYLKMMNVPYVGCGVLSSAVCMDKEFMKVILTANGIRNSKFLVVHSKNEIPYEELVQKLGSPFFIKPANTGSSVGVHKIKSKSDYEIKIQDAFLYDHKVIVEEYIQGKELEISVLGHNKKAKASVPGELIIKHEFYSYEAKYLDANGAEIVIPARISPTQVQEMQQLAIKAYQALDCEGLSRIDFFMKEDGTFYINELNTLPGFTKISMYPKMWQASGLSYSDLISELIQLAIEKFEVDLKIKTDR